MKKAYLHIADTEGAQGPEFKALLSVKADQGQAFVPMGAYLQKCDTDKKTEMLKRLRDASFAHHDFDFLTKPEILSSAYSLSHGAAQSIFYNIDELEACGVHLKLPKSWRGEKPQAVKMKVDWTPDQPRKFGLHSLLRTNRFFTVGGKPLSKEDWAKINASDSGLCKINGQWIMAKKAELQALLDHWDHLEAMHREQGIPFTLALRLLSGWQNQVAGQRLVNEFVELPGIEDLHNGLSALKGEPLNAQKVTALEKKFSFQLRTYQKFGVKWLFETIKQGMGALLADDMGLGKTLQVIVASTLFYEALKDAKILVVAPASLLSNWQRELIRFSPEIPYTIAHHSAAATFHNVKPGVTITTYASLRRYENLLKENWDLVILDEAQKIKNYESKTSQAIHSLQSRSRIVMTGTPIENKIADLWSIMEFANPGLLGSRQEFLSQCEQSDLKDRHQALRKLLQPFILKRDKTDPEISRQLPDKIEKYHFLQMTSLQIEMYKKCLEEMKDKVRKEAGKFTILPYLMELKKICNHPSHANNQVKFEVDDSCKFQKLTELASHISEKDEKFIVFTQFATLCPVLLDLLEEALGLRGDIISGNVAVPVRQKIIDRFQDSDRDGQKLDFLVLSLHASGVGLNITAANHVIHFDRWWNPAVENQATDRSHRIGQEKTVIVHKFVTSGTIEDRIHELIQDKVNLSKDLFDQFETESILSLSPEKWLELANLGGD